MIEAVEMGERQDRENLNYHRPERRTPGGDEARGMEQREHTHHSGRMSGTWNWGENKMASESLK